MAIYHCNVSIINRKSGRSSIAAIAYRSGEKITNNLDLRTHDYSKKRDVVYTQILTPENAPSWTKNRSELWNAVEEKEVRINSQTAREMNIALPVELNFEEQKQLVKEYAQDNFVNKGMIADIAIHDKKDGNPHAHIMLTTREITPEGFTVKNRDWNSKENLQLWREGWANSTNKYLEKANVQERVDHRSFKVQGIEKIPTIHLGVVAHAMEKRKEKSFRGDINREIEKANNEIGKLYNLVEYSLQKKAKVQELEKSEKLITPTIENEKANSQKITEKKNESEEKVFLQKEETIASQLDKKQVAEINKPEELEVDYQLPGNKKAVLHTEELLREKEARKPTLLELRQRDEQLTKNMHRLLKDKYTTLEPYFKKVAERYIENKYKEPEKALAAKKANYITKVEEYNSKGAVFRFASNLTKNTKVTLDKETAQIQSMERQLKQSKEKDKETITLTGDDKQSKAIRSYCLKKTKENPKIKQIDQSLELVKADRLEVSKQIRVIQDERVLQRKPKEKTLDKSMYFGR